MTYLQELLAQYTATHWRSIDDDARAHLAGFVAFAGPLTAQALPGESGSPMDIPALAVAAVEPVEGDGSGEGKESEKPDAPTPEAQR